MNKNELIETDATNFGTVLNDSQKICWKKALEEAFRLFSRKLTPPALTCQPDG